MHQAPLWQIFGALAMTGALCCYLVYVLWDVFHDLYGAQKQPLPSAIWLARLLAALYVALVFIFGVMYAGIYEFDREAFAFSDIPTFGENPWSVFYFSTATMTSTGYGDIHPKSVAAMAVATVEMLCGYFMTVFFLSVIAGLAFRKAEQRE